MRRYARKFIFFLFALLVAKSAFAALPSPIGYVNDFAGVLDKETSARLEQLLSSFEKKTGDEIAVAIVKSLEGRTVEDYAVDLYKTWGIGKKGKDNGVLILVSPSDRQMRIEVGYGLEGVINDAMAGRIIRDQIIPAFKEGRFDIGIWDGTVTVINIIAKDAGIQLNAGTQTQYEEASPAKKRSLHTVGSILFFILLAYLFIRHPWLFLLFLGSGGGGGRSGGFGGGFGGFGGGLSGGGGASGRW